MLLREINIVAVKISLAGAPKMFTVGMLAKFIRH
jgi:hypothetical protein